MTIGYLAVERFDTTPEYRAWSKLHHVKEIVSFDTCLCPNILNDEDDDPIVYIGNIRFYSDLSWLLSRVTDKQDFQILAIVMEPDAKCDTVVINSSFRFYGYDLLEDMQLNVSALTNCGGKDKAFSPSDISEFGLIEDFNRAREIQIKLREEYPEEDHADCTLWAIWRWEP